MFLLYEMKEWVSTNWQRSLPTCFTSETVYAVAIGFLRVCVWDVGN